MQRQQHSRVDLGQLKGEIVKKLGAEKAKTYFFYLNRFLSSKTTKVEFDKICFRVLGRENIVLHNQLISSILRNAYHAKVPPGVHGNGVCKPSDAAGEYVYRAPGDEIQQTRSCSNGQAQTLNSSLLSNGSILLPSPRKARSGNRERKFPTQAGGKAEILSSASKEAADGSYISVLENGNAIANHTAVGELIQHNQILPKQLEDRGEVALRDSNKLPLDDKSRASIRNSTYIETGVSTRSLLQAPLAVPLCAAGKSGARKALALSSSGGYVSPYDCGGLLDSETLKHGMEQIAAGAGLQGVSLDSANLLNIALDTYLKRMIRSSIELAGKGSGLSGSGSGSDLPSNKNYQNPLHGGFGNPFQPSNQPRIQSSYRPMDGILQEQRPNNTVSLQDFASAMEMNPQQLGEDWPLLQEKMCINSFRD